MTTNEIKIRKFKGLVGGGKYIGTYWVGMALPAERDADDHTMVEVTPRFLSRSGLDAWLTAQANADLFSL